MDDGQRALDRWVARTDGSTIVLEQAAAQLIESREGKGGTRTAIAGGEFLGICYVVAVLSGAPYRTVQHAVGRMAGYGEEDE